MPAQAPSVSAPTITADPDLRALFRDRRFEVVPWGEALTRPVAAGGSLEFELWDRGEELLARQHGTASAGPAIERLRRWAAERGAELVVGAPLGTAPATRGKRVEIPRESVLAPPAFRFAYPYPEASARRLRITPWGFSCDPTRELRNPWRGVAGEVRQTGRDAARATFAHVDPEHRAGAERALRAWAAIDGWELAIDPSCAPAPLGDPAPAPDVHPASARCGDCGDRLGTGTYSHLGWGSRGWIPTRCRHCGGRLRWWASHT